MPERSHYLRIISKIFALLLPLFLISCGGGGSENNVVQITENQLFKQFFYSNPQASLDYFTDLNAPIDGGGAQAAFSSSGIDASGYNVNLIRVSYLNNNFPQYAIHIANSTNTKLLVYNHGHGGLPGVGEDFARQFIRGLLDQGYDVLLTSMPLVGLNAINTSTRYWAKVYGNVNSVYFDNALITPWVHFHAVYEIIDDKDHYLHFFIDPALMFSSLVDKSSSLKIIDTLNVRGLPTKKYDETSYVGLSGGGNTGLTACAIFSFKKCILVAGFLPKYLRVSNISSWGDAEQISRSLYSIFPYEKIMELAAISSKSMVYIYNRLDPCCFADPEATRFRDHFPTYDIRLVDNSYHGFDSNYIITELAR